MTHGMSHLWAEQVPRIRFGQRIREILPGDFEDDNMSFFMPLLNSKALRFNLAHSGYGTYGSSGGMVVVVSCPTTSHRHTYFFTATHI